MLEQFNKAIGKLYNKLEGWFDEIILMLPNLIIAAIVFGLTILVARWLKNKVNRVIQRITDNPTISSVASSVTTALVVLLGLFIVLKILGLSDFLAGLLASAGVVGLAVGLALQDPLINLFSGVIMSVRQLYNLGDLVETNGHFGNIQKISLRSTIIRSKDGSEVVIPNKDVVQNPLKNHSVSGQRRVDVNCGVSYGDDLEQVRELVIDTIKGLDMLSKHKPIDFYYTDFGDSSINFTTRFWLNDTEQKPYIMAKSAAIIAIKKAFDTNDIAIPFPIRTLDFGVKGGVNIQEAVPFKTFRNNGNDYLNGNGHSNGKLTKTSPN